MKDIVLLRNKPWKHTKYLTHLTEQTGSKVIAFLCSKLRIDSYFFMVNPDILYIPLSNNNVYRTFAKEEHYIRLRDNFPDAEIQYVDSIQEIKLYYNRENTVIIVDMEKGNDFSFEFSASQKGQKIYYSAESVHSVEYVIKTFGSENILIPDSCISGELVYEDYTELIAMLE